jgi:hypothetical protein
MKKTGYALKNTSQGDHSLQCCGTPADIVNITLKKLSLWGRNNGKADFAGLGAGFYPAGAYYQFKTADLGLGFWNYFQFIVGIGPDINIHSTFYAAAGNAQVL